MRAVATAAALFALGACAGGQTPERSPEPRAAAVARPRPAAPPPGAAPAWRARPVVADAAIRPGATATVAAGETLATLAARLQVSPGAIAVTNRLLPGAPLQPGRVLMIPAGRYHLVRAGETGAAIALAYKTDWRRIVAANALAAPFVLEIGDRLLVPPRPAPRRLTLDERARANRLDIDDLLTGTEPARPRAPLAPRPPAGPAPRPAPVMPLPRPAEPSAFRPAWPIDGRVLSGFGRKAGGRINDGINIEAVADAPVRAAADGVVVYAGTGIAAFGGLVLIRHEGGWVTAYAHNAALLVAKGARVARGQPIARAGATGEVDSAQLHFEIRRGRTPVDPAALLPPRDGG